MHTLQRIAIQTQFRRLSTVIARSHFSSAINSRDFSTRSSSSNGNGEDEWNDAWETAWLPEDLSASNQAPWETDVNFPSSSASSMVLPSDADPEAKAFVEDMNDNWNERRKTSKNQQQEIQQQKDNGSLYSLENMKKDYRLKKQRIHAGLWMKEIEKQEEAKLGDSAVGVGVDIERLLDSCSEYVLFLLYIFASSSQPLARILFCFSLAHLGKLAFGCLMF